MENKLYDIIIIGGGPAGLTASIYALRAKKSVFLIERMGIGGQVALTTTIENYPGFMKIDGADLSLKMFEQATALGLEFTFSDVVSYDIQGAIKSITTYEGVVRGKSIILCMGATARQLEVENEKKFLGKGVSYCATCDGNFYKGKNIAIVGGGDSAIDETLYLSNIVNKIYLIHRRDSFKNEEDIDFQEVVNLTKTDNPKVEILTNSVVCKLIGEDKLQQIEIENKKEKNKSTINVDGLFVAIGRKPDTTLLEGIVNLDSNGFILTDENMKTNIDGVYAAGDIRHKVLKQIVTACSDGATATVGIISYLAQNKDKFANA